MRKATGLEVIAVPRSAWMVSWPGWIPCLSQVCAMNFSASRFDSQCHHPADDVTAEHVHHDVHAAGAAVHIRTSLGGIAPLSFGYQFAVRSFLPPLHLLLVAFE
jgi:hypothetical protein